MNAGHMNIGVIGSGAVGGRILRQLDEARYISRDFSPGSLAGLDLLILANESMEQPVLAGVAIAEGISVITTADKPDAISALLRLDNLAKERGVSLVVGATYSPGMSCVLAAYLASQLDKLTEIHIARVGTGGPACARNYHSALSSMGMEYYEGNWRRRPGGSGRELVWFPEPIGGADCYSGALPEPLLLSRTFKDARRITAKRAATRRDRLTSPFPMLRPPPTEGSLGAIRVEARGISDGRHIEITAASVALPAMATAMVLLTTVGLLKEESNLAVKTGVMSLSEIASPKAFLAELVKKGIGISMFHGINT